MTSTEPYLKIPVFDPPPQRGRRRRFYLKELEVYVRPLEPDDPRFQALLELLFPDPQAEDRIRRQ